MDLTSLISTIITSIAALVAIIGGLLVSRVISLANDQHFLKRQVNDINLTIQHKEQINKELTDYFFEDELSYFVSKSNLVMLIKEYSLEEIIEKDTYISLTKEELEPHFKVLLSIKDEVSTLFDTDGFSRKVFKGFVERKEMQHPDRSDWYETMLEAIIEFYNPPKPGSYGGLPFPILPSPSLNLDHKQKIREKELLERELEILKSQKDALGDSINDYLQTKGIWVGIAVLMVVSLLGMLYPATLLPYSTDYYDDGKTKILLITLFAFSLISIFGYLMSYLYVIMKKNKQ